MQVIITAVGPDNSGLADPIVHHVTTAGANIVRNPDVRPRLREVVRDAAADRLAKGRGRLPTCESGCWKSGRRRGFLGADLVSG